jgi:protein-S-isoprenylcysteine O-methyltransferase Ste14
MNAKTFLVILVVLFVIGFMNPMMYWTFMHLARTVFVLLIGVGIGYLLGRATK